MEKSVNVKGNVSVPDDKWFAKKEEIDDNALWLNEGDTVTVHYGDFEEITTKRRDKKTDNPYETHDFKVGVTLPNGVRTYWKVSKYLFSAILQQFADAPRKADGKIADTISYTRPFNNRSRRY